MKKFETVVKEWIDIEEKYHKYGKVVDVDWWECMNTRTVIVICISKVHNVWSLEFEYDFKTFRELQINCLS